MEHFWTPDPSKTCHLFIFWSVFKFSCEFKTPPLQAGRRPKNIDWNIPESSNDLMLWEISFLSTQLLKLWPFPSSSSGFFEASVWSW